jgi:hypothetical protein
MSKPKHPGGRPSKYKPEYCQRIIDFMDDENKSEDVYKLFHDKENGVTEHAVCKLPNFFEDFAHEIDVTCDTMLEWCKVHPEFSESYKKAKEIQLRRMVKGMLAGGLNTTGTIFALKNMHKWADRAINELSGVDGGAIEFKDVGPTINSNLKKVYGNHSKS